MVEAEQKIERKKETNISWEAQEYVQHDKNVGWYVALIFAGLVLVLLSIWLQWWTFTALIILSVVTLMMYAMRPPRVLSYTLTNEGLKEGERLYKYEEFKSFGVLKDDKRFAVVLMPRKRFAVAVTVYFPEAEGEKIVDMFGMRLPMEEVKLDFLDEVVKKLRI